MSGRLASVPVTLDCGFQPDPNPIWGIGMCFSKLLNSPSSISTSLIMAELGKFVLESSLYHALRRCGAVTGGGWDVVMGVDPPKPFVSSGNGMRFVGFVGTLSSISKSVSVGEVGGPVGLVSLLCRADMGMGRVVSLLRKPPVIRTGFIGFIISSNLYCVSQIVVSCKSTERIAVDGIKCSRHSSVHENWVSESD